MASINKKGFTLVEIILVVAIIVILTSAVIVGLSLSIYDYQNKVAAQIDQSYGFESEAFAAMRGDALENNSSIDLPNNILRVSGNLVSDNNTRGVRSVSNVSDREYRVVIQGSDSNELEFEFSADERMITIIEGDRDILNGYSFSNHLSSEDNFILTSEDIGRFEADFGLIINID